MPPAFAWWKVPPEFVWWEVQQQLFGGIPLEFVAHASACSAGVFAPNIIPPKVVLNPPADVHESQPMQLTPGDKLGPDEITGLIGKGGMGEVYRGTDTRLGRAVAIKVSAREFTDRFEREARAISALNHPNICTLYDVGPNYLVMEFVEGDLLSKLIEQGPLPLHKALTYATQIVDALAAAHAKGVIHRDLKPGNIIITRNGAKVLDFGLAKLSSERLPRSRVVASRPRSAVLSSGWPDHGRQLHGERRHLRRRQSAGVAGEAGQHRLRSFAGRQAPGRDHARSFSRATQARPRSRVPPKFLDELRRKVPLNGK